MALTNSWLNIVKRRTKMTLAANGLELDLGYRCGLSDRPGL